MISRFHPVFQIWWIVNCQPPPGWHWRWKWGTLHNQSLCHLLCHLNISQCIKEKNILYIFFPNFNDLLQFHAMFLHQIRSFIISIFFVSDTHWDSPCTTLRIQIFYTSYISIMCIASISSFLIVVSILSSWIWEVFQNFLLLSFDA